MKTRTTTRSIPIGTRSRRRWRSIRRCKLRQCKGQLAEILTNGVEEAYFGVKSAEDALNDAHAEMQALLDEFWAEFDADNM